jgi:hypothetical protein
MAWRTTTSGTAPFECPDEIATGEVDQVKAWKSIKRDIPFALRRGTIGQVTTHHHHHALDGFAWLRLATPAQCALVRARPRMRRRSSSLLLSRSSCPKQAGEGGGRRAGGK